MKQYGKYLVFYSPTDIDGHSLWAGLVFRLNTLEEARIDAQNCRRRHPQAQIIIVEGVEHWDPSLKKTSMTTPTLAK